MAQNDVVLLDSLVEKSRSRLGASLALDEIFEMFCFEEVLKDYDLSDEELETGWTDGTNDGGVDGLFVFVDGKVATEDFAEYAARQNPEICVVVFTVRHYDAFQQQPLDALSTSIAELFNFRKAGRNLNYPFLQEVLAQRELFRKVLVGLADRRPSLKVWVHYCCRGDTAIVADNLSSRCQQLQELIESLFSDVVAKVELQGAAELLRLARREKVYSLRLKFIESYISREGQNYVVLTTLPDYCDFISDESGKLRSYLFESNVRDYLGEVKINQDIMGTLERENSASVEDFWWLNNGVTILATHAIVVGKEMSLENVQIVNGLQTTETIHRYFGRKRERNDDRAILLKIILTSEDSTRVRIIKATNYQNSVDLASLRGLDKVQVDIEHFLADHGWFYDRRKNFYKNQGKPADRIISMPYLGAAVRAIALRDPARSARQRSRSLRDDNWYAQVFDTKWDLGVYLASLEITRAVEQVVHSRRTVLDTPPIAVVHYIGFAYACSRLGNSSYRPNKVAELVGSPPVAEDVLRIRGELRDASFKQGAPGRKYEGVPLNKGFLSQWVKQRYG